MWYRTYFQNVTFDNFTGFFEEIKFVEENSVTFKLSNLEIQAQVNAGVDVLRILPVEIEYVSVSNLNIEITVEVRADEYIENEF